MVLHQWFLTGVVNKFPGGATLACSTTWKVFERECVPSKRYTSANLRRCTLFGLVPAEMEVGVKFFEILRPNWRLHQT